MKSVLRALVSITTVGAAALLCTTPANAAELPLTFDADATTTIAKLNQTVDFGQTRLETVIDTEDFVNGTVTGQLNLPQATTTTALGPITLATITLSLVDATDVTGTATFAEDFSTVALDVEQSFAIKIDKVVPLGLDTGSAGSSNGPDLLPAGSDCRTAPTTAELDGLIDLDVTTIDATLAGSYTIPQFTGCGPLLDPVLNTLVSGPNNPLSVAIVTADTSTVAALRSQAG